ncbi:hypothetical protein OO007_16420 [Cocleimonas sp. KMM 6892]|uniref:hypothetical protein n=1 Tax=unclassified Cocleimonas TaxID=2639732 RepID=UPI002DBB76AB|nr:MULTISPECIES: hypothetical protein [unclassified Cocleimonas]MEB8433825.1 hypothetical protein [Cocleimonas sp. KMM 6892]MEC4716636.1 hypothetical protein [Cocleimonas sp. KMM 6895]MEC4746209.1 hypothetical protein [Cocleimonas sp. KMM 6896]
MSIAALAFTSTVTAAELSGNVAVEGRLFTTDPAYEKQTESGGVSLSFLPEFKHKWDNEDQQFTFTPFYRWDENDDERTHGDIRQLDYLVSKGDWEYQLGISKKFWGVTESQHLVDIINQTDGVEGIDGEDKLGQPMFRVSRLTDTGSVDFFVLPYFRERTFSGVNGRFRTPLVVDTDAATYESASEDKHIDYAVHWSESLDEFDFGVHLFDGTSRDPDLRIGQKNGEAVLVPHYPLITQLGLDLQYTGEAIIWKLEAIHRKRKGDDYSAAVGGVEYTLPAISESGAELGLLAEYHRDSRGEVANAPFQNDLFFGARLALNDEDSSELLAGAFVDLDNSSKSLRLEASRRIGNGMKLNIEGQVFTDVDENDPFYTFSKDDYIQVELEKFF